MDCRTLKRHESAGFSVGARRRYQLRDYLNRRVLTMLALAGYVGWRAWVSPVEVYAREDGAILLACFVAYLMTVTAVSHPKWRLGIVCDTVSIEPAMNAFAQMLAPAFAGTLDDVAKPRALVARIAGKIHDHRHAALGHRPHAL